MTQKERIIQYILHTPCNNNRQILESLLLNLETGEYYFDLIKDEGAWEDKSYSKYSAVYDENGNIYIAITDVSAGTPLSDQSHWVAIMKDAGSIQSDWNQNDDTKKDYVKCRTHWVEDKLTPVPVIEDAVMQYNGQGAWGITSNELPPDCSIEEGMTVHIKMWDTVFTKTIEAYNETDLAAHIVDDTGKNIKLHGYQMPVIFIFERLTNDKWKVSPWGAGGYISGGVPLSISIELPREFVHTLDPKYIKDMYYTETNLKELLCEFTTDGSSFSRITMPERLEPDTVYIWTFNEETGKSLCKRSASGAHITAYIEIADYGLITEDFSTATPDNYITAYNPGASQLPGHITISKEKPDIVHQIDPKYIPNQNTVFEARLFPDSSIPNKLNLESGIAVGDLIRAFDEGRRVIARVCVDEDDDGIPFEMQMYYVNGSSGIPYKIMFAPCSRSLVENSGAIDSINTMVIGFIEGNWYFGGFALDAIGGAPFETLYTVPFEVNAMYCNTFAELESATQNFRWRAYIYKGNYKLYLQIPEYSSSVTPNTLYFSGITEPDGSGISSCVWTTVPIEVSPSNVILWDDSTLPNSNSALDTWDYYKLNKDQSGALRVYDVFNEEITILGLVGKGVIEYGDYRYLFNRIAGYSLLFYCMDFTNNSVPKISTISIDRRTNTIGVTNFQPLWEIATESEVNNAVDDIFKTI